MASPLPHSRNGNGRGGDGVRRQISIVTVAVVFAVAFVVVYGLILAFGDPDAGEPKVVLKVEPQPRAPSEVISQTPQAPPGAAPSSSAALIAANGVVISDPTLTEQAND